MDVARANGNEPPEIDHALEKLQRDAFAYFLDYVNPANGLVADNTRKHSHCSIAVTGLGLAAYVVGAERGFLTRADATERTLTTLRFFRGSPQSQDPLATGYQGFYYHFLDMPKGQRAWSSELSMIDTALLIAGALASMMYFQGEAAGEKEIRELVRFLYERINWPWAMHDGPTVAMGWKPECGFMRYGWEGYSEATVLYVLGLGSPTHPLPPKSYDTWTSTYQWENLYGHDVLFAAPFFIHQLSHAWIDFRGIRDAFMREKRSDYFENSRSATFIQQQYAVRNPRRFRGYDANCWGLSASDGPGISKRRVDGIERQFFGYLARGVPYGPDDGTVGPWAVLASLPFAPEVVLPALRRWRARDPDIATAEGMLRSVNPTFETDPSAKRGLACETVYGLEQGPVVLMIENYRSGLVWRLMRRCRPLIAGLRGAGFRGGWLRSADR